MMKHLHILCISILVQASLIESFASQLAQKCDIPMEVGVLMMGKSASSNETYRLQLFRRDMTEVNSGGNHNSPFN